MAKSKIATAYVQVVPTTQGIRSQLAGEFGGHGDAAGGSFGASLVGKLKGIIAGAGLAKIISDALSAGAESEQLTGGVQKIFDEMDTSVIMADAADAYKSLNMSANQYLATINDVGASFAASMGDEKGYNVAKTGLQAISDYASGTGKNVDTLAEKFTMITRSTSSYQSIADQFSGILPATSADFLAQAQAAGFLSGEYEKLTQVPVAEYQQAVSEMLKKGTANLGLAGNTAAEAATTFSGSFASMKAAASDLLANLTTGGDVAASLANLGETVYNFAFLNLLPMAGNIVTGIGKAIIQTDWLKVATDTVTAIHTGLKTSAEKIFGTEGGNLLLSAVKNIRKNLPQFLELGSKLVGNLATGAVKNITELCDSASELMDGFDSEILDCLPDILAKGKELVGNLVSGALEKLPDLASSAGTLLGEFATKIVLALPDLLAKGGEMVAAMIDGIGTVIPDLISAAGDLVGSFCDTMAETDWCGIGNDIVYGIIDGLTSMGSALWDAAKSIYNSFTGAIKGLFEIKSPSKKMRDQVGKMLPAGIAVGVKANLQPLKNAALDLGSATMNALSGGALRSPVSQGNTTVTLHVYAAENQNVEELTDVLMRKIQLAVERREVLYG